jgi:hypothetical protein
MEPLKIISSTRHSHERARLGNMNMPMEVLRQTDGTYKATVRGQETAYAAVGPTQSDALYALKQAVKGKMLKGDFKDVHQRTV